MSSKSAAAKQAVDKPVRAAKAKTKPDPSLEAKVDALADTVAKLADAVSQNAKDVPLIINRQFEPMEEQIGQDHVREFDTAAGMGEDETILEKPKYDIDNPAFEEKAANLAFMEQMVTINIHTTNEQNAAPYFEISVNGISKIFHRGKKYTIPRYFVEGLARAKPVSYKNEEYTMSDGVRTVRWPSATGLRYGFSVERDPHPRGLEWLRSVIAQP